MKNLILKRLLSACLFLVGLFVILQILSFAFQPKDNTEESGMQDVETAGILGEAEGTVDVVFLGDSEVLCSICPTQLYNDYGITSYAVSSRGQRPFYALEWIDKISETQTPKLVFVETDMYFRLTPKHEIIFDAANQAFGIVRYHDRWKNMKLSEIFSKTEYTHTESDKGYLPNAAPSVADTSNYMIPDDTVQKFSLVNDYYLDKMVDYCNAHGYQMVLYSTPSTINWNYRRHNGATAYAEEKGIPYIDLNVLCDELGIDWNNDSRDFGDHLNDYGAWKVTNYLGSYIKDLNIVEDHRGDETYSSWWN